jgi:hypothetical protein
MMRSILKWGFYIFYVLPIVLGAFVTLKREFKYFPYLISVIVLLFLFYRFNAKKKKSKIPLNWSNLEKHWIGIVLKSIYSESIVDYIAYKKKVSKLYPNNEESELINDFMSMLVDKFRDRAFNNKRKVGVLVVQAPKENDKDFVRFNELIEARKNFNRELKKIKISSKEKKEQKFSRKRTITQSTKDKVWNRDGGKCIECGSNENLEFDHIIPFSKGGANTYRNIQLLCQSCNRKKSDKIG